MAWYPGYERTFNQFIDPNLTYALGKVMLNHAALAVTKPGVYPVNFADAFTPSLLIYPRLQSQSKHWVSDTPAVVVTPGAAPAGGKKKK